MSCLFSCLNDLVPVKDFDKDSVFKGNNLSTQLEVCESEKMCAGSRIISVFSVL